MTKEVMHPKAAAMEQLSFSASAGQTALAHLCGPLDENLRQMETILGVKIVRRGEQFRVSGEKHAAHRALRALEVLLDRVARTGAELTPNDIQWHFVGGDDEHRAKTANADEVSAGEVLLKTRRHDLRGRHPISGLICRRFSVTTSASASVRLVRVKLIWRLRRLLMHLNEERSNELF